VTGPSGTAGETGTTGATGSPLPSVLPQGKTERGAWIATSSSKPELSPFETVASISFTVPLAKNLEGPASGCPGAATCHAKELSATETKEIAEGKKAMAGCKAVASADPTLLEEPVAESGNLCAYTGAEENTDMLPTGILNVQRTSGSSRTGAIIGYEVSVFGEPVINARGQGTWAVTG
jgi:hypothetical protein